jgi:hypothetical protein
MWCTRRRHSLWACPSHRPTHASSAPPSTARPTSSKPPPPRGSRYGLLGRLVDNAGIADGPPLRAGSAQRVVLTSSTGAVHEGRPDLEARRLGSKLVTEAEWSRAEPCEPYFRSKTLAERAAWVSGRPILSIAANGAHQVTWFCIQRLCIHSGKEQ